MPIKINREETNLEVLARIAKAAASQYDCSLTIDFQDGKRRIEFIGDDACKGRIADRVRGYFHPADGEQA
jgi:hypothetical protein